MKKSILTICALLVALLATAQSTVYVTRDISPESLVKIYKALGVEAKGRVAVKISTGEGSNPNYLKPELIKDLVLVTYTVLCPCDAMAIRLTSINDNIFFIRQPLYRSYNFSTNACILLRMASVFCSSILAVTMPLSSTPQ